MSPRPFLIVGTQRTGSGLFVEALNHHPHILCGWEWTNHIAPWRAFTVAERALSGDFSVLTEHDQAHMRRLGHVPQALGFKRLFRSSALWIGHPDLGPAWVADRLAAHLKWIARRPHLHVLHLIRRDHVGWLKSKALSRASQRYQKVAYPDDLRVRISPSEAIKRIKSKTLLDARLARLADTNPYVEVPYEGLSSDTRVITLRALAFLGCDPALLPELALRKPQSRSAAAVENLTEVADALRTHGLLAA